MFMVDRPGTTYHTFAPSLSCKNKYTESVSFECALQIGLVNQEASWMHGVLYHLRQNGLGFLTLNVHSSFRIVLLFKDPYL